MAKGDAADSRSQIQASRNYYTPQIQQYTNSLYPQQQQNWQNFNAAGAQNVGDYLSMMGAYQNFANNPGINYNRSAEMQSALGGFQNFANTGGFSPQDLQDIRARAVSPIRAEYQNAMNQLSRNRNLSGGYSPNYNAALAKMTREQSYNTSDAMTNANAAIAQMVQQGKLSGLQGLGGLSTQDAQLALQALTSNAAARNAAMSGMSNLYGTTPGLSSLYLRALQGSNSDIANALGLGTGYDVNLLRTQAGLADAPGDFDIGLGRVTNTAKTAGGVIGMF